MSEIKTPQAGEWWETRDGCRAYVVSVRPEWAEVSVNPSDYCTGWIMFQDSLVAASWSLTGEWVAGEPGAWNLKKRLPDCTGWDWKEPDWAPLDPETYGWHVLRAGVDQCKYKNDTNWQLVDALAGRQIGHRWYCCDYTFRCLRKDLPIKPPAKPDPGEGFRLLEPEEKVIQGDEYWEPKGTPRWEQSDNWRYRNGEQSSELVYRRRKEKPSAVVSLDVYKQVITECEALKSENFALKSDVANLTAERNELKRQIEQLKDRPGLPDCGDGYRYLRPCEPVIKGDDAFDLIVFRAWSSSVNWSQKTGGKQSPNFIYRRKIASGCSGVALNNMEAWQLINMLESIVLNAERVRSSLNGFPVNNDA